MPDFCVRHLVFFCFFTIFFLRDLVMANDDLLKQRALDYHEFPQPGKLSVQVSKSTQTQGDLSLAYTPGVAKPVLEIEKNPNDAYRYTCKGNLIAVMTNGTAVLGLGDVGPLASKPVMEGKAVLFKQFANIDVFDIEIDAKNPRTASREIPAGIISEQKALYLVLINCVLFIATTFYINAICFYLSPIALFTILFYSYTKRFTSLCHFVLGIGLSLAPIGAYLAVAGAFSLLPILFSITVFTWVAGFDIMYALQDEEFDKSEQLFSIPSQLGITKALKLSIIVHFITAALIVGIGFYSNLNYSYWIGASIFIALLIYQHKIVKPNDLSRINLAFGTTNGIASLVFAFFTILSIYFSK